MPTFKGGFSRRQVMKITGVTRRQLSYWRDTGLVTPSRYTAGGHARYAFTDLVALRTARQLVEAGISVQRIRASIAALARFLPTVKRPLTELSIVATGDVILVLRRGDAFEALTGQEWILPVAELHGRLLAELGAGADDRAPVQRELFSLPPQQFAPITHQQSDQQLTLQGLGDGVG